MDLHTPGPTDRLPARSDRRLALEREPVTRHADRKPGSTADRKPGSTADREDSLTEPAASRPARRASTTALPWRLLLPLAAGTFATVTSEMLPAAVLPQMSADLLVPESRIGLLVTMWAITIAVLSLPLVRATRRFDRRALMAGALLVVALGNVVAALAPTYAPVAAARVVAAGAHGVFWAVVAAYVAAAVSERQLAKALAVVMAGPTLAGVLGLPMGAVLGQWLGWRGAFVVVGLILAGTALAVRMVLPGARGASGVAAQAPGPQTNAKARSVLFPVIVCVVAGAVVLIGHFALFTDIAPLITEGAGFSAASVGPLLAAYGLAGVIGLLLAGPLQARTPRYAATAATAVFGIAALAMLGIGSHRAFAILALLIWGLAMALFTPVFQGAVLRLAGRDLHTLAGGVLVVGFNTGIALGAALGGVVFERTGLTGVPVLAVVMVTIGLVVIGWLGRREGSRVSARDSRVPAGDSECGRGTRECGRGAPECWRGLPSAGGGLPECAWRSRSQRARVTRS